MQGISRGDDGGGGHGGCAVAAADVTHASARNVVAQAGLPSPAQFQRLQLSNTGMSAAHARSIHRYGHNTLLAPPHPPPSPLLSTYSPQVPWWRAALQRGLVLRLQLQGRAALGRGRTSPGAAGGRRGGCRRVPGRDVHVRRVYGLVRGAVHVLLAAAVLAVSADYSKCRGRDLHWGAGRSAVRKGYGRYVISRVTACWPM